MSILSAGETTNDQHNDNTTNAEGNQDEPSIEKTLSEGDGDESP